MRESTPHILLRLLVVALLVLVAGPCAAAVAWGPPRSGGFGPNTLSGGSGADFLRGAEGHDTIHGRGASDLLTGDTGPDVIHGGAGNDTLSGGSGNDALVGGEGDDIASGGFGADGLDGGPGGDALNGDQDKDAIFGGAGDDVLHGGSGIDRIDGGPGNDRIFADSGGDTILGGEGDDVIVVDGSAFAHIACGPGRDIVYLTVPPSVTSDYAAPGVAGTRARDCEVVQLTDAVQDPNRGVTYLAPDGGGTRDGTALDDVLLGGPGADTLRGGAGNDVLWGLRQAGLTSTLADVIDAGPGDDTVYGGPGPQRIAGGAGDDFLEGGLGNNVITAGAGDDTIRLRGGASSTIRAGEGRDTIFARGPARATIDCGTGRDIAHVDRGDTVSRTCERVVGTPRRRTRAPARRAVAAVSRAAIDRAATSPTYADLVGATAGLKHWWRMSPTIPATSLAPYASFTGLYDKVTGVTGSYFAAPTELGPTDDGDTAFESSPFAIAELYTSVADAPLHGDAFTFEGWFRPGDSGVARALLNNQSYGGEPVTGVVLGLEADGSLHATVAGYYDPRRVDVRTPPLALGTRWHHVALSRTPDRISIFVDGALSADAAATPVSADYVSPSWYVGREFNGFATWIGGIDEIAVYDRALDATTVRDHARAGDDGQPPVTRTKPAFGPLQAPSTVAQFATDKGGSLFRCGLDGTPLAPCSRRYVMSDLAEGRHVLRVEATDRFGLTETTPTVLPFVVDSTLPHTLAFVWLPADGDRRPTIVMGSEKPGTFECFPPGAAPVPPGSAPVLDPAGFPSLWTPCASGSKVPRGSVIGVRAVDLGGNRDAEGLSIPVPGPGSGFQGPESGIPTFAGARVEVGIGSPWSLMNRFFTFECKIDGAPWQRCRAAFRLPILHAGRHTMQVRQIVPGTRTYVTTRELVATVAASTLDTTIVGLQADLVIEHGVSLTRRPPLVRLALNRPAALQIEVFRGGKRVVNIAASGTTGPNVVRLPAPRLQALATGRYGLVVTARGTSGTAAIQRLPLAIVPRLG